MGEWTAVPQGDNPPEPPGDCPVLCWQFRHFDWCPHQQPEPQEDSDGV